MIFPPSPVNSQTTSPTPKPMDIPEIPKAKGWRRVKEIFIAEDWSTVKEKVFETVVVPSIKDFLYTIGTSTLGLIFYGSSSVSRVGTKLTGSFVNAGGNRFSFKSHWASDLVQPKVVQKRPAASDSGYTQPLFNSREDAQSCLDQLVEMLDNYDTVRVNDLYSIKEVVDLGAYQCETVFDHWGWTVPGGFGNAMVKLTPNGWTMNLPSPKHLGDE